MDRCHYLALTPFAPLPMCYRFSEANFGQILEKSW